MITFKEIALNEAMVKIRTQGSKTAKTNTTAVPKNKVKSIANETYKVEVLDDDGSATETYINGELQ